MRTDLEARCHFWDPAEPGFDAVREPFLRGNGDQSAGLRDEPEVLVDLVPDRALLR